MGYPCPDPGIGFSQGEAAKTKMVDIPFHRQDRGSGWLHESSLHDKKKHGKKHWLS